MMSFLTLLIHQSVALSKIKTRMLKECHRQGQGAFIRALMDKWKDGQRQR